MEAVVVPQGVLQNEKEAQEYIEEKHPGFTGRFIKPVNTTCAGTNPQRSPFPRPVPTARWRLPLLTGESHDKPPIFLACPF